jgi:hypothetical protein
MLILIFPSLFIDLVYFPMSTSQSKPITIGNQPRSSSVVSVSSSSRNHYNLQVSQEMRNTQYNNMQEIGRAITTGSNEILNEGT